MKKTQVLPAALIALMLLGVATAGAANINPANAVGLAEKELLKENIPATYEATEGKMTEAVEAKPVPIPHRFLMWTHDGKHIMWGRYAGGYFVGTDNLGKKAWGIYHGGRFAGFYDGELFTGKYRNGFWKAKNLFGERITRGRYVLFPPFIEVSAEKINE